MGRARRLCLPVHRRPYDTIQGVDCQIRPQKMGLPTGKNSGGMPKEVCCFWRDSRKVPQE